MYRDGGRRKTQKGYGDDEIAAARLGGGPDGVYRHIDRGIFGLGW
jgi:hypothetical protein